MSSVQQQQQQQPPSQPQHQEVLSHEKNPDWVIGEHIGRGRWSDAHLTWNNNKNSELYGRIYVRKQVWTGRMPHGSKDKIYARNEAGILAKFKDEGGHIVGIFESYEASGSFIMLIEYCCGGDLDKRVKKAITERTWFSEDLVMSWFCQISSALQLCHDRKILHRDVKTKNIFLTKEDTVKLGDFGISREFDNSLSMAETFVGTPATISPEIFLQQRYSYKTDIWSLGCVLFELLALRVPFPGRNIYEMQKLIVHSTPPPIPAHYSQDVAELVQLLLEKDPVQRPDIVQVLDHPFVRHHMSYAPRSAQKCMARVDEVVAARHAHRLPDFDEHSFPVMPADDLSGFFNPPYSPNDTYADSTVPTQPNTLSPDVMDEFSHLVGGAAESKACHDGGRSSDRKLYDRIGGAESKRLMRSERSSDVQCGGCSRRIPHAEAVASAGFCDECRPTTTVGSHAGGAPIRPHPEHSIPPEIEEAWRRHTETRSNGGGSGGGGGGGGSPRLKNGLGRRVSPFGSPELSPRTSSLASLPPPRDGDVDLTRQRQHRHPVSHSSRHHSREGSSGSGGAYQHQHHRRKSSHHRPSYHRQQSPPDSPTRSGSGRKISHVLPGSAPGPGSPLLNGHNGMVPHPKLRSSPSLDSIRNRDCFGGGGDAAGSGGDGGFNDLGVPHHRVSRSAEYEMDHGGGSTNNGRSTQREDRFWEHNGAPSKFNSSDPYRVPTRPYHAPPREHHDPAKLAEGLGLPPSPYVEYSPKHSHSRQSPPRRSPRNSNGSNQAASSRNSRDAYNGVGPASHDFSPSQLRNKFGTRGDQPPPIQRPNGPQPSSSRHHHQQPPRSQPGPRSPRHHRQYSPRSHSRHDRTERPSAPGPTLSVARPVFHNPAARSQPHSRNPSHQSSPSSQRSRNHTPRSSDSRADLEAAMLLRRLNSEPSSAAPQRSRESSRSPRNQSSRGPSRLGSGSRNRASTDDARSLSPEDNKKSSSQPNSPRSSIFGSGGGGAPTRPPAPFAVNSGAVSMPRERSSSAGRNGHHSHFGGRRSNQGPMDSSGRRPPRPAQQRQRQQEQQQQAPSSAALVRPMTMDPRRNAPSQRASNSRVAAYHNRSLPENLHMQNARSDASSPSIPSDSLSPFPAGVVNAMARFAYPRRAAQGGGTEHARTYDTPTGSSSSNGVPRRSFERVDRRRGGGGVLASGGAPASGGGSGQPPRTPFVNVNSRVNHVYEHPEALFAEEDGERSSPGPLNWNEARMKHRRSLSVPNLRRDDFGTPPPAEAAAPSAQLRDVESAAAAASGNSPRPSASAAASAAPSTSAESGNGARPSANGGAAQEASAPQQPPSRARTSNPQRNREQLIKAVNLAAGSGGNANLPRPAAALMFENAIRSMSDEEAAHYFHREQHNKPGLVKRVINRFRFGASS